MKTCAEYFEDIYYFNQLAELDKQELHLHIKECSKCSAHYQKITGINKAVKEQNPVQHLGDDLLLGYLIYRMAPNEPDPDGKRLSATEIKKCKKHLKSCAHCKEYYNRLHAEYLEMDAFLQDAGIPDVKIGVIPFRQRVDAFIQSLKKQGQVLTEIFEPATFPKLVPIAAAGLVLLFLVFLQPLSFLSNKDSFDQLSRLERIEISYATRDISQTGFIEGIALFNQSDYSGAGQKLSNYISISADSQNLSFAHYVCGLSFLMEEDKQRSETGREPDIQKINRGIVNLQSALKTISNNRIKENIFWYLGKASLMKKDLPAARDYFQRTVLLKGKKFHKARKMLKDLENS